jgi:hypothetical protein
MVTKSMMGVSSSSAVLVPKRGTTTPHATSSKYKARAEHEREIE